MKIEPKISIIVPVYNAERYLEKCIISIIRQEYTNFELILVDDGSIDRSPELCDNYANIDKRIRVIHQINAGVSIARNNGIKISTGDYIVFVDADDSLMPHSIKSLYYNLIKTGCQLVCGSYQMKKTRNRVKKISYKDFIYKADEFDKNFVFILKNIANAPWGKLFDAQIIRKYQVEFPAGVAYGEDSIFLIRYCKHISSISICSDILYNYNFLDADSAMKKFYPKLYQYFSLVMEEKEKFFKEKGKIDLYNKIRMEEKQYYFEWCVRHYIFHAKHRAAKILIEKAAKTLFYGGIWGKYQKYIDEKDWDRFIREWKKDHWREIFVNAIKQFI